FLSSCYAEFHQNASPPIPTAISGSDKRHICCWNLKKCFFHGGIQGHGRLRALVLPWSEM
ncbi:unnamed protein product, partial [Allacma fusca]